MVWRPIVCARLGYVVRDRGRRSCRFLLILSVLALGSWRGASAQTQQPTPLPTSTVSLQDLAKIVHNPFEDYVKLPFQFSTGFNVGPNHNVGASLNFQPLIPFRLTSEWDLMARPSLNLTYLPGPGEQFGLQDLQTSFFFTPHDLDIWLWGIGPVLQFPTASSTGLGNGKWAAGPTAAFIYENGPWFAGILTYQLMSYAGNKDRGSINQTYLEPQVSYNWESGWFADVDPQMTFDWTADSSNGWTIPLGADAGKAFIIGSQSMSWQLGAYDLVKRPQGNPQWFVRVQLTVLMPKAQ